jgi:GTP-binding protein
MAFWGRSNVGKSSLINALINRKSLARISSMPGKTQTINYYNVEGKCYLVDLPGYGYAKISKKVAEKWAVMIRKYLENSKALRVIFLLIDIRHEPMKKDADTYRMLTELGFNPLIIATKADKISKSKVKKQIDVIRKGLHLIPDTPIIAFSSVSKEGKDEIWEYIAYFLENQRI